MLAYRLHGLDQHQINIQCILLSVDIINVSCLEYSKKWNMVFKSFLLTVKIKKNIYVF